MLMERMRSVRSRTENGSRKGSVSAVVGKEGIENKAMVRSRVLENKPHQLHSFGESQERVFYEAGWWSDSWVGIQAAVW